jgi:aspartate aminotransferase
MELSLRLKNMAESETLAMSQKSREMRAKGIDVINLSVGEPDFFTPDHIKKAAQKAIDDNFSFYSPVPGYLSLREAICDKLKRENGLTFEPSQIVCSNGAKQAVCNVLMSVIGADDEVIVPAPYWVSYVEMVKMAEGTPIVVHTEQENDFKLTPEQLEAAITPRTKALILCSPSNPTGSVYTRDELSALAAVLANCPNILIISDEIYEHINYLGHHESIAQFDKLLDRVAIVNGVSKAYAMTGWRLGWVAAPQWLAKACSTLQGQYTSGASSIAQKAAEAAYRGPQQCVKDMREAFRRRRDLVVSLIAEIPGLNLRKPMGAFYAFPECKSFFGKTAADGRHIETASDLAMYLLDEAHVACVSGSAFGAPDFLRFSYATSDQNLTEAFARVKKALAKLK